MNIGRAGKYYYLRFIRLKGDPHSLALRAAFGVFIGITPTLPFHTIIILILTIVTRSSFLAALIMSWLVCNPLTYIPQYYFALRLGNLLTPYDLNWERIKGALDAVISDATLMERLHAVMALGVESIVVMLVGGILLAIPFAVLSYYFSYYLFFTFRKKRNEKRILK